MRAWWGHSRPVPKLFALQFLYILWCSKAELFPFGSRFWSVVTRVSYRFLQPKPRFARSHPFFVIILVQWRFFKPLDLFYDPPPSKEGNEERRYDFVPYGKRRCWKCGMSALGIRFGLAICSVRWPVDCEDWNASSKTFGASASICYPCNVALCDPGGKWPITMTN